MKKGKIYLLVALGLLLVSSSFAMGPFSAMHKPEHQKTAAKPAKLIAGQPTLHKTVKGLQHMVAQITHGDQGHREIKALLKLAEELKLSEEQVAKLRELDLSHQKTVIRKNAAASEALAEIENLLVQSTADRIKLSYKNLEVMGAVADITDDCLKTNLEVKSLLSAKQNKDLDEHCSKMRERQKQDRGCCGKPGCSMEQRQKMMHKGPGY